MVWIGQVIARVLVRKGPKPQHGRCRRNGGRDAAPRAARLAVAWRHFPAWTVSRRRGRTRSPARLRRKVHAESTGGRGVCPRLNP